jgi:hypothetical protein
MIKNFNLIKSYALRFGLKVFTVETHTWGPGIWYVLDCGEYESLANKIKKTLEQELPDVNPFILFPQNTHGFRVIFKY